MKFKQNICKSHQFLNSKTNIIKLVTQYLVLRPVLVTELADHEPNLTQINTENSASSFKRSTYAEVAKL